MKTIQILGQNIANKAAGLSKYTRTAASSPYIRQSGTTHLSEEVQRIIDGWNIDSIKVTAKKGRTTQEQIEHLNNTWQKEVTSGSFGSFEHFENAEMYTKPGKLTRYLIKDKKLYYLPEKSNFCQQAYKFNDSLYNKLLGQTRECTLGSKGYGFNQGSKFVAYQYIEADANIADYPNLLKEGFGLDLLLSTPISAKSVIVKDGQAIRLKNGLIKYIGNDGGTEGLITPKDTINWEVKISEYFDSNSEAYNIIKNFTETDIKEALRKLFKIKPEEITNGLSTTSFVTEKSIIPWQYQRIEEQLILRRKYLEQYLEMMEKHPKKSTELMSEYLERIEEYLPKYKNLTPPIDNFALRTMTDKELLPIEHNWQTFQRIRNQKFENIATDIIEQGSFTHNAKISSIESVLDNGLMTGQSTLCKMEGGSNVPGNWSSTQGQLDTFIVNKKQGIKAYFNPINRHEYENGWLQKDDNITYIIDKSRVSEFEKNFKDRHFEYPGLDTHYIIPFGVPTSCIDRIVVSSSLEEKEVNNIIKQLEKRGLDIKLYNRDGQLLYDAKKTLNTVESIVKKYRIDLFGKQGLPLKYSRAEFRNDVWNLIAREVPESEITAFLSKFNLTAGKNGVLDGVPVICGFVPKTQTEKKMLDLIKKFYNNEIELKGINIDKSQQAFNSILKEFPEFSMVIGKPQHGTHAYSVDVHSLLVLQKAMNIPAYERLSQEGKEVLRLTALMHDFGKMGGIITPGHAKLSREMAERVLNAHNINPEIKNRVLNQIEHHHWFESYNTGNMSAKEFAQIFPNSEDQTIAALLAKGDFESVNPTFHLQRMTGRMLSPQEYESAFSAKINKLSCDLERL